MKIGLIDHANAAARPGSAACQLTPARLLDALEGDDESAADDERDREPGDDVLDQAEPESREDRPVDGVRREQGLVRAAPIRIWLMFNSVQPTKKCTRPASEPDE